MKYHQASQLPQALHLNTITSQPDKKMLKRVHKQTERELFVTPLIALTHIAKSILYCHIHMWICAMESKSQL